MTESLEPTFVGFIACVADAAMIIEGSMQGYLPRVACRPPQRWQVDLAKSGHIFVFEEKESDVKRWTDGVQWSPSRVHDGFMLYRELDGRADQNLRQVLPVDKRGRESVPNHGLYGSLIDSYPFRAGGLMKKTISVRHGHSCWRLISYYQVEDVTSGRLTCPSQNPSLWCVQPNENIRRLMRCWDQSPEPVMALYLQHDTFPWGHDFAFIPDRCDGMSTPQELAQYEAGYNIHTQAYQM